MGQALITRREYNIINEQKDLYTSPIGESSIIDYENPMNYNDTYEQRSETFEYEIQNSNDIIGFIISSIYKHDYTNPITTDYHTHGIHIRPNNNSFDQQLYYDDYIYNLGSNVYYNINIGYPIFIDDNTLKLTVTYQYKRDATVMHLDGFGELDIRIIAIKKQMV